MAIATADEIRELRKRRGWSQGDLADELGVRPETVNRWERQGTRPTRSVRRQIARLVVETDE